MLLTYRTGATHMLESLVVTTSLETISRLVYFAKVVLGLRLLKVLRACGARKNCGSLAVVARGGQILHI